VIKVATTIEHHFRDALFLSAFRDALTDFLAAATFPPVLSSLFSVELAATRVVPFESSIT